MPECIFSRAHLFASPQAGGQSNALSLSSLPRMASSLIVSMAVLLLPTSVWCQDPDPQSVKSTQMSTDNKMLDAKKMIQALVNHNPPPKINKYGDDPVFDDGYDFNEQHRIPKAIDKLLDHAEDIWPALVDAVDDDRYSVTFKIHDYPSNWSVAQICAEIIYDYLAQGYYSHSVPDDSDGRRWNVMMMRPVAWKEIKKWCQDRKNKKLYELQIETCQWAIENIPKLFPDASKEDQQRAIDGIKKEIESLETTKKPLRPQAFYMWKGAMGEGGGAYGETSPRSIR